MFAPHPCRLWHCMVSESQSPYTHLTESEITNWRQTPASLYLTVSPVLFFGLVWICASADFTNTFRSLASVQPEDSSEDLPGPLQEVNTLLLFVLDLP